MDPLIYLMIADSQCFILWRIIDDAGRSNKKLRPALMLKHIAILSRLAALCGKVSEQTQ